MSLDQVFEEKCTLEKIKEKYLISLCLPFFGPIKGGQTQESVDTADQLNDELVQP